MPNSELYTSTMDASTNSSRPQHLRAPIPAKPPPCRGSGYAADPVDGEAILVEQVRHLAHEVDQVRRREVRIEVFPGNPILVEGEEPRVLDPLVEVVVDVALLPRGRLDQRFECGAKFLRLSFCRTHIRHDCQKTAVLVGGCGHRILFSMTIENSSATLVCMTAPRKHPLEMTLPSQTALEMAEAAAAWLGSLNDEQRATAHGVVPAHDGNADAERRRWFYTPTDHGGLTMHQQAPAQQRAAMQLVATGLSLAGYVTVATTMGLENVLDRMEGFVARFDRERGRDPGLYYLRVFGVPGGDEPWGWRFGGHHVSLNN